MGSIRVQKKFRKSQWMISAILFCMLMCFTMNDVEAACTGVFEHSGYGNCGNFCAFVGGNEWWFVTCDTPPYGNWVCRHYICDPGSDPCGGGCFTPDTPIDTPEGVVEIGGVEVGDEVASFKAETGEESTSVVEKIYEATRAAYYKIKTTDGKEVKVTAEHPLYAKQQEVKPMSFWEYLKTESLTSRVVGGLFQ